jgi:hypothetical protein
VDETFQPLRIPAGWLVVWNVLFAVDPTEENVRLGFFGGSSLFAAVHEGLRLNLDLEWRPEDDPAGEYQLTVEYAPWLRTARGRRRKGVPLDFSGARVVHEFHTRDRTELVWALEAALVTRSEWVEHS